MSYKILKQNDNRIVLQDTGGIIDFIFGIVLVVLGAGLIYFAWFGYQDTGELFLPVIITLVGSCFFFPAFKSNRLVIDAINKEIVKSKSWFVLTTNKEVITNHNLSLVEMTGDTSNELEAFFDPKEPVRHHYNLKFYSYPEWNLSISNFSTMLNIVLFIEQHFDADIALLVQHKRQAFSSQGLLNNHQKTPLPNDSKVRETAFQTLTIGGSLLDIAKYWIMSLGYISWSVATVTFILFFSDGLFTPYIPMPVQYALSALLVGFTLWLPTHNKSATRLIINNETLTVKHIPFGEKHYPLTDVIGVANIAKITFLMTKQGSETLACRIPTKYSYAIHSWLMDFIK